MFRIVIQNVPSAKIHHAISVVAATKLAQNCTFRKQDDTDLHVVEGDWMNLDSAGQPYWSNIVDLSKSIKKSLPDTRVLLEV